jgi:hypothetical protein
VASGDCSDQTVLLKHTQKNRRSTLVSRRKSDWRGAEAFNDEELVRRYFPDVLLSMQDENLLPQGRNEADIARVKRARPGSLPPWWRGLPFQ